MNGLIPARAGNTSRRPHRRTGEGAHPRSRGEHREVGAVRLDELGSSPLARGTRAAFALSVQSSGLIPARAGNTLGG